MIVIVEKNENGKIEFTKEELQALLEEAKSEGENEARKSISAPTPHEQLAASGIYGIPSFEKSNGTTSAASSSESVCTEEVKLNGDPLSSGI